MTIRDIDYDLRRLNSLFLRVILIVVLFFIEYYNHNFFDAEIYIISVALYVSLLLLNLVFVKSNYKGRIRLILDILILSIFLYKKDLNLILNYLPFILLLYNVQSHSSKNGKIYIFIILLHISIFIIDMVAVQITDLFF